MSKQKIKGQKQWRNTCVCMHPGLYLFARRRALDYGMNFSQFIRLLLESDRHASKSRK